MNVIRHDYVTTNGDVEVASTLGIATNAAWTSSRARDGFRKSVQKVTNRERLWQKGDRDAEDGDRNPASRGNLWPWSCEPSNHNESFQPVIDRRTAPWLQHALVPFSGVCRDSVF